MSCNKYLIKNSPEQILTSNTNSNKRGDILSNIENIDSSQSDRSKYKDKISTYRVQILKHNPKKIFNFKIRMKRRLYSLS
jgi:hypothetical protein